MSGLFHAGDNKNNAGMHKLRALGIRKAGRGL